MVARLREITSGLDWSFGSRRVAEPQPSPASLSLPDSALLIRPPLHSVRSERSVSEVEDQGAVWEPGGAPVRRASTSPFQANAQHKQGKGED